jgi:hypothetical protein
VTGSRLGAVAARDDWFLAYDPSGLLRGAHPWQASRLLDGVTLLLARLPPVDPAGDSLLEAKPAASFWANLEHLLRCLRQLALDVLVRHGRDQSDRAHRHRHRAQPKRLPGECFAEFSSSHRPLSMTWPWDIKPSLMVLWGVCWMFYQSRTGGGPHRHVSTAANRLDFGAQMACKAFRRPACCLTTMLTAAKHRAWHRAAVAFSHTAMASLGNRSLTRPQWTKRRQGSH